MFCRHCGKEMPYEQRFCTDCGGDQQQEAPEEIETKRVKKQGWRFVGYLVGAIIIGASVGGLFLADQAFYEGRELLEQGVEEDDSDISNEGDQIILFGLLISVVSMTFLVLGAIIIVNSMRAAPQREHLR